MASRTLFENGGRPTVETSGQQTYVGNPVGAFKTLAFALRNHRKLESAIDQNRRAIKKGWVHTGLHHYKNNSNFAPLLQGNLSQWTPRFQIIFGHRSQ